MIMILYLFYQNLKFFILYFLLFLTLKMNNYQIRNCSGPKGFYGLSRRYYSCLNYDKKITITWPDKHRP